MNRGGTSGTGPEPGVAVTVEVVVLTVRSGRLHVLVTERSDGGWSLPGGDWFPGESLAESAERFSREAGVVLDHGHVEQLASYGEPGRDPGRAAVAVAHVAFVPDPGLGDPPVGGPGRFWPVRDLAEGYGPRLALDHDRIVDHAVERARAKLEYTTLATRFAPDPFTIADLYEVYRAVWGTEPGDRANFARKVKRTEGFVVPTESAPTTGGRGRPSMRYTAGAATNLHPPIMRPAPTVTS